jgi:prepilin-type N-terminal cleavage/methylation domain-containing protein
MKQKGFTLIELLMVSAIVLILASVVMFFVSQPKDSASDIAVKNNLSSAIKQGNIYFLTSNSYGAGINNCSSGVFGDTLITQALAEVDKNLGSPKTINCYTSISGNEMAVLVNSLKEAKTNFCMDSSNFMGVASGVTNGLCVK